MKVRSFFFTRWLRSHTNHWHISMGNIFSTAWNKHGWWSTNTCSLGTENILEVFLFLLEPPFFQFLVLTTYVSVRLLSEPQKKRVNAKRTAVWGRSTCPVGTSVNRGWHWWLRVPSLYNPSWTKLSTTTLTPINSTVKFSPAFTGKKRLNEQMLQDQNLTY